MTLITGDQVTVGAGGQVAGIEPAPGRENMPFSIRSGEGSTFVVPLDAREPISRGIVDARLFDVTELSRPEYAAHAGDGVPVIVLYEEAPSRAETGLFAAAGPEVRAELESVAGRALTLDAGQAAQTWEQLTGAEPAGAAARSLAAGVSAVVLDGLVQADLDTSVPQIGTPAAWEAGLDGTGVRIAVLDTGIDTGHPDLAGGRVIAERNFSGSPDARDRSGHGTHVASTAAGTGAKSGGRYTGVAPGAELISAKVLGDDGWGQISAIVDGMEWAVGQGADIVNLSLGWYDTPGIDPLEEAVNRLSETSDALFVAAAGNSDTGLLGSPASADAALAVGAVDSADALAGFSGHGGSESGAVKPDLTAPGVGIGAAAAEGSVAEQEGTPVMDGYTAISGTSMAAPHVAGAAALLKQQHPDWTGERLKAALVASATGLSDDSGVLAHGTGRVDLSRAVGQTVIVEETSLVFGTALWPHPEQEEVSRTLTYRNLGEEDVTLDLSVLGQGPEGLPEPEGMFSLSADRITVPAGGTTEVQAVVTPWHGRENPGDYGLLVTAAGDGQTVRTAGRITVEGETYEYTVQVLDREGDPVTGNVVVEGFRFPDTDADADADAGTGPSAAGGTSGTLPAAWGTAVSGGPAAAGGGGGSGGGSAGGQEALTFRVPAGRYSVEVLAYEPEESTGGMRRADAMVLPLVEITEDTGSVFDARQAEPLGPTLFDENAGLEQLYLHTVRPDGTVGTFFTPGPLSEGLHSLHVGPAVPDAAAAVSAFWRNGDTLYQRVFHQRGGFFTGLAEHVTAEDLAQVSFTLASAVPGAAGGLSVSALLASAESAWPEYLSSWLSPPMDLPTTTTWYLGGGPDILWGAMLFQGHMADGELVLDGHFYSAPPRTFEEGGTFELTFGNGVFGPGAPSATDGVWRYGDTLYAHLYPLADGAGNTEQSLAYEGTAALYRGGEEIWASAEPLHDLDFGPLPEGEARYELRSVVRPDLPVSTEVSTSYFFTSAHVPGDEGREIPVSVVRFSPELALDSTAPAHRKLRVPVTVHGAAAGGNLGSLRVEVSYDGGDTWQEAAVHRGRILVDGPAPGGSVSFRSKVSDTEGNRTTQTIIDAYRTR
ncbi:S8 family serine peptidase [Streptomyces sp. YIM 98790]|uniref:S8 family serine peptidase n=1 Tax=Streptomyces sp. YIM 98790 TaxID=2689077 RepID=UPI0014084428|nr:S8 family serine peptidase [Streptomyces sp. YIM 98790]